MEAITHKIHFQIYHNTLVATTTTHLAPLCGREGGSLTLCKAIYHPHLNAEKKI